MKDQSTDNRPVILISGSRGLAKTLLHRLTEAEYRCSVLVRDPARVGELKVTFPELFVHVGDVSSHNACREWVSGTLETYGRLDALINNAAIQGEPGRLGDLPLEAVEAVLKTDLVGPIHLSQLVIEQFLRQRSGTIINLSGGGATQARPRFIPYAISKCALVRLTECLAEEYPELRFYAVSPGGLKTTMTQVVADGGAEKSGEKEFLEAKTRLEKGGEDPNRAADLMLWLLENRPVALNGKLISAIHDDYHRTPLPPESIGWWNLRRVDAVAHKKLKELGEI